MQMQSRQAFSLASGTNMKSTAGCSELFSSTLRADNVHVSVCAACARRLPTTRLAWLMPESKQAQLHPGDVRCLAQPHHAVVSSQHCQSMIA